MWSTRNLAQLLRSRHRLWQSHGAGFCTQNHLFCASSQLFCTEAPAQSYGPNISALDPHLQQQWHPTANQHLVSIVISKFSRRKAWWACHDCPDGYLHEWEASMVARSRGSGCPQCSGHKLCKHSSLATKFPEVAPYWDVVKNGCTADQIHAQSNQMAYWKCPVCNHAWIDSPHRRVCAASACAKCNLGHDRQPYTRHPTFAACQHHLLQEWDFKRNDAAGIFPSEVTLGSMTRVHWKCDKCPAGQQHLWVAKAAGRTGRKHSGCPFCANKAVCKCNSLQTHRPAVAAEWHPSSNAGTPDDYTVSSRHGVWWQNKQQGAWQQTINSRVYCHDARVAAGR